MQTLLISLVLLIANVGHGFLLSSAAAQEDFPLATYPHRNLQTTPVPTIVRSTSVFDGILDTLLLPLENPSAAAPAVPQSLIFQSVPSYLIFSPNSSQCSKQTSTVPGEFRSFYLSLFFLNKIQQVLKTPQALAPLKNRKEAIDQAFTDFNIFTAEAILRHRRGPRSLLQDSHPSNSRQLLFQAVRHTSTVRVLVGQKVRLQLAQQIEFGKKIVLDMKAEGEYLLVVATDPTQVGSSAPVIWIFVYKTTDNGMEEVESFTKEGNYVGMEKKTEGTLVAVLESDTQTHSKKWQTKSGTHSIEKVYPCKSCGLIGLQARDLVQIILLQKVETTISTYIFCHPLNILSTSDKLCMSSVVSQGLTHIDCLAAAENRVESHWVVKGSIINPYNFGYLSHFHAESYYFREKTIIGRLSFASKFQELEFPSKKDLPTYLGPYEGQIIAITQDNIRIVENATSSLEFLENPLKIMVASNGIGYGRTSDGRNALFSTFALCNSTTKSLVYDIRAYSSSIDYYQIGEKKQTDFSIAVPISLQISSNASKSEGFIFLKVSSEGFQEFPFDNQRSSEQVYYSHENNAQIQYIVIKNYLLLSSSEREVQARRTDFAQSFMVLPGHDGFIPSYLSSSVGQLLI